MTATERVAPEGFAPHFRKSNLTDPWEPLFSRRTPEAVHIGLWTAARHANSRGFVHGGLLATLADNAMGLSCYFARGEGTGAPVTVGLSIDYLASVGQGQWLEVRPTVLKLGRQLGFASAVIVADEKICARANGTFQTV